MWFPILRLYIPDQCWGSINVGYWAWSLERVAHGFYKCIVIGCAQIGDGIEKIRRYCSWNMRRRRHEERVCGLSFHECVKQRRCGWVGRMCLVRLSYLQWNGKKLFTCERTRYRLIWGYRCLVVVSPVSGMQNSDDQTRLSVNWPIVSKPNPPRDRSPRKISLKIAWTTTKRLFCSQYRPAVKMVDVAITLEW